MPDRNEKIAYEAGKTASARIGDKAMCYDPIMDELIAEAKSESGCKYNHRIMAAWINGRAEKSPKWSGLLERLRDNDRADNNQ